MDTPKKLGRPKMPEHLRLDSQIHARIKRSERAEIERAAGGHANVSDWLRAVALRAARRINQR